MAGLRLTCPHELKDAKSRQHQSRRQRGNRCPHFFVNGAMYDNDQHWTNQKRKPANIIIHAKALLKRKPLVDDADAGERNTRDRQRNESR